MELRQLRHFVAVAEEEHVTRAAERLGMQQPPLSQSIRALEREVGTALFRRLPRGMALTPAGETFLLEARAVLERSEGSIALARLAANGQVGRLTVGITTSASLHPTIPSVLGLFHQAHPAVCIDVREDNAANLTDALMLGKADAVLLRAAVSRPIGLVFEELDREPLVVVLPRGHRLGGRRLELERLRAERFILVRRPAAPGLYAEILDSCRAVGFEPVVVAEVGRMLTAVNLVAAGLGVTLVPSSMAAIRLPGVKYSFLADRNAPTAPLTLVHRKDEDRPVVIGLLQSARDAQISGVGREGIRQASPAHEPT